MSAANTPLVGGISLTTQAANKLKELKQKEDNQQWGLRFADKQGFCGSGYEYMIDFASEPLPQEEVFYSHGIPIYVPKESMQRLQGSTIQYDAHSHKDQRLSALEKIGFSVSNPNVKGDCPCGCDRGFDA
ncbi:MAG: iron-sulfur cluster assembly accessory protein [Rhabdochlamydiaceae bacterium]